MLAIEKYVWIFSGHCEQFQFNFLLFFLPSKSTSAFLVDILIPHQSLYKNVWNMFGMFNT